MLLEPHTLMTSCDQQRGCCEVTAMSAGMRVTLLHRLWVQTAAGSRLSAQNTTLNSVSMAARFSCFLKPRRLSEHG